jgi:hypothetical protein
MFPRSHIMFKQLFFGNKWFKIQSGVLNLKKRIKITYFNGSERMEKLRKACGGVILYFALGVK